MNIVYIHSHDTGRYIQPYGHAIPTPALQQLAEEGVCSNQLFVQIQPVRQAELLFLLGSGLTVVACMA